VFLECIKADPKILFHMENSLPSQKS